MLRNIVTEKGRAWREKGGGGGKTKARGAGPNLTSPSPSPSSIPVGHSLFGILEAFRRQPHRRHRGAGRQEQHRPECHAEPASKAERLPGLAHP